MIVTWDVENNEFRINASATEVGILTYGLDIALLNLKLPEQIEEIELLRKELRGE